VPRPTRTRSAWKSSPRGETRHAIESTARAPFDMTPDATTYHLVEGRGLPIKHFGEQLRLLSSKR
jgi:hypothetical protein